MKGGSCAGEPRAGWPRLRGSDGPASRCGTSPYSAVPGPRRRGVLEPEVRSRTAAPNIRKKLQSPARCCPAAVPAAPLPPPCPLLSCQTCPTGDPSPSSSSSQVHKSQTFLQNGGAGNANHVMHPPTHIHTHTPLLLHTRLHKNTPTKLEGEEEGGT